MFSDLPHPQSLKITAYRNIATVKESQWLFDDLVDVNEIPTLWAFENLTSQIDHQKGQKNRSFQYGDVSQTLFCFDKTNWKRTRFADGKNYGVWYGSLEEETAIYEILYWTYRQFKVDFEHHKQIVKMDRKMFRVKCDAEKLIDLRPVAKKYPDLVNKNDYQFCWKLGEWAIEKKVDCFLTPSARKEKGTCIPVFNPKVIKKEEFLYYFHYTFFDRNKVSITKDKDELIEIPSGW